MQTAMFLKPVSVHITERPWWRATSARKSEVTTVLTQTPVRPL